jgi:hypothetical protein
MKSKSFRIVISARRPRASVVRRQANEVRASRYADRRTARLRTRTAREAAEFELTDDIEGDEDWGE